LLFFFLFWFFFGVFVFIVGGFFLFFVVLLFYIFCRLLFSLLFLAGFLFLFCCYVCVLFMDLLVLVCWFTSGVAFIASAGRFSVFLSLSLSFLSPLSIWFVGGFLFFCLSLLIGFSFCVYFCSLVSLVP